MRSKAKKGRRQPHQSSAAPVDRRLLRAWLPAPIYERLSAEAMQERRTLARQVLVIIEGHLQTKPANEAKAQPI